MKVVWLAALLLIVATHARAADGLVAARSPYPVKVTVDRVEAASKTRNLVVFARIDHAAGAMKGGKTLRPTELLIFGNPQGGTPFMECAQTVGIDLPLKMLAWEDESGQVWLGYNDPQFLAQRHGVADCPAVQALTKVLAGLRDEAVAR